jgi:hypothetical protein
MLVHSKTNSLTAFSTGPYQLQGRGSPKNPIMQQTHVRRRYSHGAPSLRSTAADVDTSAAAHGQPQNGAFR